MADSTAVELDADDADDYRELYREFEWWADRNRVGVERALENTPLAVGVRDGDELVAAARVLTDFVYYAKVYDVIVAERRRGEGLGSDLMESIVAHPALVAIDVIELVCREGLIPFYEQCGFEPHDMQVEVDGRDEEFVKMNHGS